MSHNRAVSGLGGGHPLFRGNRIRAERDKGTGGPAMAAHKNKTAAQSMCGRELGNSFALTAILDEIANALRRHYITRAAGSAGGDRTAAVVERLGLAFVFAIRHHEIEAGLAADSPEQPQG